MLEFCGTNVEDALCEYAELCTRKQGRRSRGEGRAQCQILTLHKERSRMEKKDDNKSFEGKEFINNEESSEAG